MEKSTREGDPCQSNENRIEKSFSALWPVKNLSNSAFWHTNNLRINQSFGTFKKMLLKPINWFQWIWHEINNQNRIVISENKSQKGCL